MTYASITGLPIVPEEEATGELGQIYANVKRTMGTPVVPNIVKYLAASDPALGIHWGLTQAMFGNITLPPSLVSMIRYSIATRSECVYCSSFNEMSCRTLGVDDQTLDHLVADLESIRPQRLRVIIEFALRVAEEPRALQAEDYAALRDEGVTDEEILEIVVVAALCVYHDILADALKIELDDMVRQALAR